MKRSETQSQKNNIKNISIIGLGKLGSCMAAVYATKGFSVIGVDIDENYVKSINNKKAPVIEPLLQEYIDKTSDNLKATSDYEEAILNSDITFIIVPTPTDETGGFSVEYVQETAKEIGNALAKKDAYHLITLTSTVLPEDSIKKIIPTIEKYSGKKCGVDFGYCYSPEFIALGSVINDLLNADFFLIGQYDKKSGEILKNFYSQIAKNIPAKLMSISSAELAKISLNSYITTKITFANMLAEISENITGVDVGEVLDALGEDKRIGKKYLKSGLGFGGPCFPRDNIAFAYMAEKYGIDAPLAKKVHIYNEQMTNRIINKIKEHAPRSIAFLSLSYKPGTPITEKSHIMNIVKEIIKDNDLKCEIHVYEPAGYSFAKNELKENVIYHNDLHQCLENSDFYFIGNPMEEFVKIEQHLTENNHINKAVFDPWRVINQNNIGKQNKYLTLGLGPEDRY